MDPVKSTLAIASQLESQSLNSIVAGFSFASAIAYMDLVRWIISQVVKVNKNGGYYYLLTALLTTLLSILVYMLVSRVSKQVKPPAGAVYAVTA